MSVAIPQLNEHGLLPTGVHPCTLDELEQRFDGGGFGTHRYNLILKLRRYVPLVKASNLVAWLGIDGSFVTSKDQPGDIDILLVLHADHDYARVLTQEQSQPLSKKWVGSRFEFDVFSAPEGTPPCAEWLEFFMQVKGKPDLRKGILKVVP